MTRLSSVTPLPPPLPAPRICRAAEATLSGSAPPPPHPRPPLMAKFVWFPGIEAEKEDGLYL